MDRPRLLTPARATGLTRRRVLGLGAAAATALVVPGCSRGKADLPAPAQAATFATGNEGGVYNQFGTALCGLVSEVTGMELKPLITNGSVDNLKRVSSGQSELGFCTSDSALSAWEGTGPFTESGKVRFSALARVYDNYVHVVVPMNSRIGSLKDLEGKVVNVGTVDSGTTVIADLLLTTAGVKVDRKYFPLEEAVAQLAVKSSDKNKGGIDAMIFSGGLPTVPIKDLQKKIGIRLIDIGAVAEEIALNQPGGYTVSSIPPSQYGQASAVATLSVPNYLIAKPNLSDSWAWWTVNTLFRRQNDLINDHPEAGALDPRSAIATMPIPLHPAAERWYRNNHI